MPDYQDKLMAYAKDGPARMINYCLQKGARIDKEDADGENALMAATRAGHYDAVMILVENMADVNYKNMNSLSSMAIACSNKDWLVAKLLYDAGANLSLEDGELLLCLACAHGELETVQNLLDRGVSANPKTTYGKSPFYLACRSKAPDVAHLLLEKGASLDNEPRLELAEFIGSGGDKGLLEALVESKPDDHQPQTALRKAFFGACSGGVMETIEGLYPKIGPLDSHDLYYALRLALSNEKWLVVGFLKKHGAEFQLQVEESTETITAVEWDFHVTHGRAWLEYGEGNNRKHMGNGEFSYSGFFRDGNYSGDKWLRSLIIRTKQYKDPFKYE